MTGPCATPPATPRRSPGPGRIGPEEEACADDLGLLADLHRDGARQGPGGDAETRLAVTLSRLAGGRGLRIADIGCGTGASTLVLAEELDAHITAVDCLPAFLERLTVRAGEAGVADRITTCARSMEALDVPNGTLDAIWSEGAIYSMGFEAGVAGWRRFPKPGGVLAVSEITWLTATRPAAIEAHWNREYPGIATASEKLAILERQGYAPIGYFVLPDRCWIDNHHRPMQRRFAAFLAARDHAPAVRALVAAEEAEIALSETYRAFVSYGFYVARRTDT